MATRIVSAFKGRTLWIAHRRELIDQAAKRLKRHGLQVGVIMAGLDHDHYTDGLFPADAVPAAPTLTNKVNVASIQTLGNRTIPEGTELIVIDEAHHCVADSYGELFTYAAERNIPIVGLTATPFRMDGKPLGDLFNQFIVAAYPDELITQGYLVQPKVYAGSNPDLNGIKITAGDFNKKQLDNAINKPKLIADIGDTWQARRGVMVPAGTASAATVWRTICFASSVEHSKQIVIEFASRGYAAEHIDGTTPGTERDAILHRLLTGETEIVSNYGVLTEGWDLPALECAIIARPTESLNLHLQMIGRVMRPNDGKAAAVVLDHAGNHHRHGSVSRRYEYSLTGTVRAVATAEPLGMRHCKSCLQLIESSLDRCLSCGAEYVTVERETIQQVDGELSEFDDSSFEYRSDFWQRICDERDSRGYSDGWAAIRFKDRFGDYPILADIGDGPQLVNTSKATMNQKRAVYRSLLAVAREKGFKDGWASHQYRRAFGVWPSGFVNEERNAALANELAADWEG